MKYKKYSYIIVLILTLIIGINTTYAKTTTKCNYLSDKSTAMAKLEVYGGYDWAWLHANKAYSKAWFQKLGGKVDNDTEHIINWYSDHYDSDTGITLNAIYNGSGEANKNPSCPEYLIVRTTNNYNNYGAFATNDLGTAQRFVDASNNTGKFKTWYLTYKNSDGTEITDEQYYSGFVTGESLIDPDAKIECSDLFGDKNDAGNEATGDPPSIAYMIHTALLYVRIIVPILIIVLGMLDLGKAVIASKEDEMKKAQTTFVKRVIIGVIIFFVPLLVDLIMQLADIVWEGMGYTVCEFK